MLVCKGSNSDHNSENNGWVDFVQKSFSMSGDSFNINDADMFLNCILFSGESSYTADCWDFKFDSDVLN